MLTSGHSPEVAMKDEEAPVLAWEIPGRAIEVYEIELGGFGSSFHLASSLARKS